MRCRPLVYVVSLGRRERLTLRPDNQVTSLCFFLFREFGTFKRQIVHQPFLT
jgi:hypothetical protein